MYLRKKYYKFNILYIIYILHIIYLKYVIFVILLQKNSNYLIHIYKYISKQSPRITVLGLTQITHITHFVKYILQRVSKF